MPTETTTHSLTIRRTIRAPRQRVFDAWVRPELRKKWWSAKAGMSCDLADIDARKGGHFRINMKDPEKNREHVCVGEFVEYDEPNKLVLTWSWEKEHAEVVGTQAVDTIVTIEFMDAAGGTEIILTHERFKTADVCDDHKSGWTGCLDSLERVLSE